MFQQLKPLVAKSPIAMNVVAEGELLRVTIAQKTSKRGTPLNISVLASAEDLDRDLPGEIDKAASQTPVPASIAEQVKAQVAAAKPSAVSRQPSAHKTKRAKKAKPAKAPRVSKPKPLKQAKAPKTAPKHKIRLPGTKRTNKPSSLRPHPSSLKGAEPPVKHHASKPGTEQCIADYKAMKAKHGDRLNRQLFIDHSKTGRRFERLWDMSWEKFVAAAEGSKIKADAPAAAPRSANKPAAAPADRQLPLLPGTWPFPESKTSSATPPAVPEKRTTEAPTASVASAPAGIADPINEAVDTSKPHPPRVVKEKTGRLIAGGFTAHVKAGDQLDIGGGKWIVSEFNERHIIVEPRDAGATS